jgi:hypothetical protein
MPEFGTTLWRGLSLAGAPRWPKPAGVSAVRTTLLPEITLEAPIVHPRWAGDFALLGAVDLEADDERRPRRDEDAARGRAIPTEHVSGVLLDI